MHHLTNNIQDLCAREWSDTRCPVTASLETQSTPPGRLYIKLRGWALISRRSRVFTLHDILTRFLFSFFFFFLIEGNKILSYFLYNFNPSHSRMESNGEPLKIHMSEASHTALEKIGGYKLECRGEITIKVGREIFSCWVLRMYRFLWYTQVSGSV